MPCVSNGSAMGRPRNAAPSLLSRGKFEIPVDPAWVQMDWRERGYDCHHFADPPGQTWKDFVHETNEVVTVVEGSLELTVGDEVVTAGPGDEVFIPRGALHSVRNVDRGTTRWLFGYD